MMMTSKAPAATAREVKIDLMEHIIGCALSLFARSPFKREP